MYNVSCEAQNCTPILLEDAIQQIRDYRRLCKQALIITTENIG